MVEGLSAITRIVAQAGNIPARQGVPSMQDGRYVESDPTYFECYRYVVSRCGISSSAFSVLIGGATWGNMAWKCYFARPDPESCGRLMGDPIFA